MTNLEHHSCLSLHRTCLPYTLVFVFIVFLGQPTLAYLNLNCPTMVGPTPTCKMRTSATIHPRTSHCSTPFLKITMSDSISRDLTGAECNGDGKIDAVNPNVTEVVVIRHGETEWNAEKKIQGQLDVELNDVGRQQAIAVAERLSREPKISIVYSSDLKRAYETAETIARICGGLEVVKDPGLRERHLGVLQGAIYHEAAIIGTKAWQAFVSHKGDQEIPGGGESLDQLYQRSTSSFQRIAKKHRGERIVVVTHGAFIETLHTRASSPGQSPGKIMNTSVNILHLSDEDEWTIKAWGDANHLNQTGFLESGFGGDRNSG